ncbi:MAG: hypothetical protein FWB78_09575 [Treponema sp.]|nr:hypothetical protein [Treponema sp.]
MWPITKPTDAYPEFARYEYLRDMNFDFPPIAKAGYGIFIASIETAHYNQRQTYNQNLILK